MKIIVESGATKSDWRLVSEVGDETCRILAGGTNVSTMPMETIAEIVRRTGAEALDLAGEGISAVHFYTAGVITDAIRTELSGILDAVFKGLDRQGLSFKLYTKLLRQHRTYLCRISVNALTTAYHEVEAYLFYRFGQNIRCCQSV